MQTVDLYTLVAKELAEAIWDEGNRVVDHALLTDDDYRFAELVLGPLSERERGSLRTGVRMEFLGIQRAVEGTR